jgi:predicted deacylase
MSILQIDNISVKEGSREFGYLELPGTPLSSIKIPIIVLNGNQPGPILGVTAGIHGCEVQGIEGAIRACKRVNPENLNGAIITVPIANVPAFYARIPYVCPIDEVNINNAFPGNPEGSVSYRIAHTIFKEVILKCNYLLDLHGGDLFENLTSSGYVICSEGKNEEIDSVSQKLASLFDTENIWMLELTGSCIGAALKEGIPAIIPEAGGEGWRRNESNVEFYESGILNVMKYLNMIDGVPKFQEKQRRFHDIEIIYASSNGFFYPRVKAGDTLEKGQLLGKLVDLFHENEEKILSPIQGRVMILWTYVAVNTEDVLMVLAKDVKD